MTPGQAPYYVYCVLSTVTSSTRQEGKVRPARATDSGSLGPSRRSWDDGPVSIYHWLTVRPVGAPGPGGSPGACGRRFG